MHRCDQHGESFTNFKGASSPEDLDARKIGTRPCPPNENSAHKCRRWDREGGSPVGEEPSAGSLYPPLTNRQTRQRSRRPGNFGAGSQPLIRGHSHPRINFDSLTTQRAKHTTPLTHRTQDIPPDAPAPPPSSHAPRQKSTTNPTLSFSYCPHRHRTAGTICGWVIVPGI